MKEDIFLCWDNTTVQGALVLTEKDGTNNITATSGPVPWPIKGPVEKWKVKADPTTSTIIWISSLGNARWESPPTEEFI
eukprot:2910553-Lingulodinium_polyedra.AAC.1